MVMSSILVQVKK